MKNILVNASAAKEGGAETILKTFVKNIEDNKDYNFIVLSPNPIEGAQNRVKFIKLQTNGFSTIFFSAIGIYYFILKYRVSKVISFNNINCIICPNIGITYFHQPKALKPGYKDFKIKVYDFLIQNFLRRNKFIVQSEYISSLFLNKYRINRNNIKVCWPGFILPQQEELPTKLENQIRDSTCSKIGVLPISYDAEHKNIALLNKLGDYFIENGILVITLLDLKAAAKRTPFLHIGSISRGQLFTLYSKIDFIIFTSKDETVGLPIFEFLQTGKPAFVYKAPYSKNFQKQFDNPKNFILFENDEDFKRVYGESKTVFDKELDYSEGEWHKIIELL